LARDEEQQKEVNTLLRQSAVLVEKLKEYERHEADLARVLKDLEGMPGDPAETVTRARAACDALAGLAQAVPLLSRFQSRRAELGQALVREQTAEGELQQIQARGKQRAAEVDRLKPLADEATRGLQQANEQAAEARILLQQARDSLQARPTRPRTRPARRTSASARS
jgi:hypothetical protein